MAVPSPYPALVASHAGNWVALPNGETLSISRGEAIARAADSPVILLNAPLTAARLGYPELSGLDLLELFAFVHPARFVVPTTAGLARALGLTAPENDSAGAQFLRQAAQKLIDTLSSSDWPEREGAWDAAQSLARAQWLWAPLISAHLTRPVQPERWLFSRLPEWEEEAPRPDPRAIALKSDDVDTRLQQLTGSNAETRTGQRDYAQAAARAFAPRASKGQPNIVLAEAGTGIGKTLGYLAPASLWAEQADGPVWLSTYTKALQRQLDRETARLETSPNDRAQRVVVRKGRENYLCLLNLEEALQGGFRGRAVILAHLVARWAAYTRDGDMVGGDLPGWLPTLFKRNGSTALSDRRGECVYAGCPHFRRCFIERATRASAQADLVIANHALVMLVAARGRDNGTAPTRLVFDEGHHLFDAADSTFAIALTGQEAIELRRWLLGPESRARGRRRGLAARLSDVASYDEQGARAIEAITNAARDLPSDGWLGRLAEGDPFGPIERLLAEVRGTTRARAESYDGGYGLETEIAEPDAALVEAAGNASLALEALARPMTALGRRLEALIEDGPDWLDGQARARIEGAQSGLSFRNQTLNAWIALLGRLGSAPDPDFVDWLALDRVEGREFDIGIHRHWLDPTRPMATAVLEPAHGALITSATLKGAEGWPLAVTRSGAPHLGVEAQCFEAHSPFDYAQNSEVLIVTDIKRGDVTAMAGAYARLIRAAQGGTLGLFTAIQRLKAVYARIADTLAREGLQLYAQHVDPIDTGTLIDIFRDDPQASLLGTDALRDGVDVPGQSLHMVVMEGVPWPRPTVLHAARRAANGGTAYDDQVVRARLAQAFGRLIRRKDDRGIFVLLSAATPSRLLTAFPPGTPVTRLTLDAAIARVSSKLSSQADFVHQHDKSKDEDQERPSTNP